MFPRMLALSLLPALVHSVAQADLQVTKVAEVDGRERREDAEALE